MDFFAPVVKQAYAPEKVDNNQQLTRLYLAEIGHFSWRHADNFYTLLVEPSSLRFAYYGRKTPALLHNLQYWQHYVGEPSHQPLVSFVQEHTWLALRQAEQRYEQTQGYQEGLDLATTYRLLTYTQKAVAVYERLQVQYPERKQLTAFKAASLKPKLTSKLLRYRQASDESAFAYAWKTYHAGVWNTISEAERLWRARQLMLLFVSTPADLKKHMAFFESRVSPASFAALQALVQDIERLLQQLKRQHLNHSETSLLLYLYQRAAYGIALTDYPELRAFIREDAQMGSK